MCYCFILINNNYLILYILKNYILIYSENKGLLKASKIIFSQIMAFFFTF